MRKNNLSDFGPLLLRVCLFVIVSYYGCQKMLGLFGGLGLSGTIGQFRTNYGFPSWLTITVAACELFGPIALLFGILTRLGALGVALAMAIAAYVDYAPQHDVRNLQLPMAMFAMALSLLLTGAGSISLDAQLSRGRKRKGAFATKSA